MYHFEDELQSRSNLNASSSASQAKSSTSNSEHTSNEVQKPSIGSRATDLSRLMKFPKELSATTVILEPPTTLRGHRAMDGDIGIAVFARS
uniref:Uncharacterized protein n=1 Tax=Solanum tuberosum TaxID=4113 RepID=M1C3E5_SOLTU